MTRRGYVIALVWLVTGALLYAWQVLDRIAGVA
jgi:hypothetical protein